MKNWSISFKLLCLVAIAILTFVGMGLYGIANTRSTFRGVEEVNTTAQDFQRGAREISDPLHRVRELALSVVMAPDRANRDKFNAEQEEESRKLDATFQNWPLDRMTTSERQGFDQLRAAWDDYKKLKAFTMDRALLGYREEAYINAIGSGARQFDTLIGQLESWQRAKIDGAQAVYRGADASFKNAVRTSVLVIILTALLVGGGAFYIVRSITAPINILTTTAARIAEKADDAQAEAALAPVLNGGDEVGQLARGFSRMVGSLRTTIQTESQSRARMDAILKSTRAAVRQLGTTSAQLMASTKEQSYGAEKQADAVAGIVTTLEEVTHIARASAARASEVGKNVQKTLQIGNAGRKAVEDSVAALNGVKQQVERTGQDMIVLVQQTRAIAEIIATVEELARQSHLLAVNTAIEAARAGESGKEFSVIAKEIKGMAEQSRKGTAQIQAILDQIRKATGAAVESLGGVTQGVSGAIEVGDQSSATIKDLALALAEVAETSVQIVASAEQQSLGVSQINDAMKNIDQVSRQALQAIQGTAQAASQLNDLGRQLTQLSTE